MSVHSQPLHNGQPIARRPPSGLILSTAIAALILVGAIVGWAFWQFSLLPAPLALAFRIAIFSLPLGAAIVGLALVWRRWGSHEYIRAHHVTQLTRASAQRFPEGLHSLSYHDSSRALPMPVGEDTHSLLDLAPPSIPSFGELLDQGKVGPGRPLLLGFRADDGTPIEGGWDALYSCGIGALQGAGKSWLAAFLLAQSAAQGGRLIVCDMHYGNGESLGTRIEALAPAFMCDIASTPDAILAALKLASDKLAQRRAGKGGQWEIVIAIDEWTSLLRTKVGDVLPAYVEDFAEQGRKYHVSALLSAQGWTKDVSSAVRNRLTSHYVMRQRPDEARYQLGLPASACPLDVRFLPDAMGYLLDVRGNLVKVAIPQMTSTDLARVATLIDRPAAATGSPFGFHRTGSLATTPAATVATGKPDGSLMVASADQATRAPGSAEAARVLDLFHQGSDLSAIVAAVRGVKSNEGRRYQTALAEITDLLRQATKGG